MATNDNIEYVDLHGTTHSYWIETPIDVHQPSLDSDIQTDVCIVGAGIAGLSCAYELLKSGKSVVVIDAGVIGCGQTGRTTAHLCNALDDRYYDLIDLFGEESAKHILESHSHAIKRIQEIVLSENIDCNFLPVDGFLFVPPGENFEVLQKELHATQKLGLSTEMTSGSPIPSFDVGPSLKFPNQAQFHPFKYMNGLAKAIENLGGKFYSRTRVVDFKGGETCKVVAENGHTVTSQSLIVATNTPVNDRFIIHTKQAAYRTYVIGATVPKGYLPKALYWDTPDPYHYLRLQPFSETEDLLIIGGEDHKTGQQDNPHHCWDRLEKWARDRFPAMSTALYRWSGQVYEPVDSIAYIGKNPTDTNVYIVTGDSGNGMTHGVIGGLLIRDIIMKIDNPWEKIYDPSRKNLKATKDYIEENMNTGVQYTDWVTPGEVSSEEEIANNEGAIIRKGLSKLAVYRDKEGHIHTFSAVCPHLYGLVTWNDGEKTWDCPCHGSRFDAYGKVLEGPAIGGLAKHQEAECCTHH